MGTNRTTRSILAACLLLTVVAAAGADPARATDTFGLARIAGDDRATTAAAIAGATFPAPAGAQTVLLARGDDFPDALAGNFSAGLLSAPLLLTDRTALPEVTRAAIAGLGARAVIVLGGSGAVADSVVAELEAMDLVVSRVGGPDRFATAALLALAPGPAAVGRDELNRRTAVLSSGLNFPDALAAGPVVYRRHFPQLLTGSGPLPASTRQALVELGIQHVIITGGAAAVPAGVEGELAALGISTERIAGDTRYGTALGIVERAVRDFDFSVAHIDVATGENFPDALAGGPHGGRDLSPLLLVPPSTDSPDFALVCDTLQFLSTAVAAGHAFGGPAAIPDLTLSALVACGRPSVPITSGGQVVRLGPGAGQYTFVDGGGVVRIVGYDGFDLFTVDGAPATLEQFQAQLGPGDDISYDDDTSNVNRDVHRLTNRVVTSGLVGDVNTGPGQSLSILNPVTGDPVGGPYQWAEAGHAFTVDGATADLATFEGSLNEGDTITVTVTEDGPVAFALTNAALTGTVTSRSAAVAGIATFVVDDAFGDEPENAQDTVFRADQSPPTGTAEVYLVDGVPAIDFAAFALALSVGDTVSVSRRVVGGVATERFELTNVTPAPITGQVTSFADPSEDPAPADPSGDRVAIVPAGGGYRTIDYSGTPPLSFVIDGVPGQTEEAFEAALTPGDRITFQPGSTSPAITEVVSLTNAPLSGQLYAIAPAIDLYGVYAEDDETLLALVVYTAPGTPPLPNRYFINGVERTLAEWEAEVAAVNVARTDLDDQITVDTSGGARNHRLTTPDLGP